MLKETMSYIQISKLIPAPPAKVFAALSQPEQLREAWRDDVEVEVLSDGEKYQKGSEVIFRMTRFGISQPLTLVFDEWVLPSLMTLKQSEGPFKHWNQKIKVESHSENTSLVTESVNYALPFGLFGNLADDLFIRAELSRLLELHLDKLAERLKE